MSATSALSNTICVSMAGEQPGVLAPQLVEEYAAYGEIARLDVSMSAVLKCFFVTFFDVRCAQLAAVESGGAAMGFPGAEHDFRCVQLSLSSPAARVGIVGGFGQFGEVAHVSATQENLVVEFFDIRSAQRLLAASGGSASGAIPLASASCSPGLVAAAAAGAPACPSPLSAPPGMATPSTKASSSPESSAGGSPHISEKTPTTTTGSTSPASAGSDAGAAGKLLRSKITNKDFSKFDIHSEKILKGEDTRTTVMVRNLLGNRARKDFLHFLEICGLAERYTFFYMPCKEHRNVPAGFAFINFLAPEDILALHRHVENGLWHDVLGDRQPKTPALSYARFQGHEELAKHFSSSAVLHEQDPDKRPIFRFSAKPQRKQQQQPQQPQQTQQSQQATQQQPALPPQQPQLQQQPQPPAHRQQPPLLQLPTQPQQPAAHQQPLVARPKDEADLGGAAAPCQQRRHQPPPQQQERCSPEVKGFAMVTGTGHTEKVGPALGEEALGGNRGAPAYVWTSQLLCDPIDKEGALVFGAPWSQLGGFLGAKGEMDRVLTLQMGA